MNYRLILLLIFPFLLEACSKCGNLEQLQHDYSLQGIQLDYNGIINDLYYILDNSNEAIYINKESDEYRNFNNIKFEINLDTELQNVYEYTFNFNLTNQAFACDDYNSLYKHSFMDPITSIEVTSIPIWDTAQVNFKT